MKILLGFTLGVSISTAVIGLVFIKTTTSYHSTLFTMESIRITPSQERTGKSLPLVTEYIASNRWHK